MSVAGQVKTRPSGGVGSSLFNSGRTRLLILGILCLIITSIQFFVDLDFWLSAVQLIGLVGLILVMLALIPNQRGGGLLPVSSALGYLFLYAPILLLVIYSFNSSRTNARWEGFTLNWYRDLIQGGASLALNSETSVQLQTGLFEYVGNSLIVATISTLLSTLIGTMVALGMERYRFKLRSALDVLLYLPIIMPDIAMGIAMAVFFNLFFNASEDVMQAIFGQKATLGFPTIIISHVAFNISFVSVVVRARLAGMDPALEEAAYDSGANEWQTFTKIILPLIMPGIIGGALLAFTLSLDDYVITFFTAGVGTSTLPIYVFGLVRFSVTPAINALSTLMMLASMVLVTLSLALQRR